MHELLATAVDATSASETWLDAFMRWAKADEPWQIWLFVFGFIAQVLFFCRWLVQWVASERRGASHMPLLFWWFSLTGATMLLIYFIFRHDPIGILGQSVGWTVYARNLWLIRRSDPTACRSLVITKERM